MWYVQSLMHMNEGEREVGGVERKGRRRWEGRDRDGDAGDTSNYFQFDGWRHTHPQTNIRGEGRLDGKIYL